MAYRDDRVENKIDDVTSIRKGADNISNELDKQAVENFELNLKVNRYKSELRHALEALDEHSYCPGEVNISCKTPKDSCNAGQQIPVYQQSVEQPAQEPIHGDDCHCSKCCPNPNPNFFQKHRVGILITVIWLMMILLGVGWTPQGAVAESINTSWVELFVNFFKMAIFAIAGFATYYLIKKKEDGE